MSLMKCCNIAIETIGKMNKARMCWVTGHMVISGKEEADLLARNHSASVGKLEGGIIHPPLCLIKQEIDLKCEKEI